MGLPATPLVTHVLAIVTSDAAKNGHELCPFAHENGSDIYQAVCEDCGADAQVVCSVRKYQKTGGAFLSQCEAGILPGMSNFIVHGQELTPPEGMVVQTFKMPGIVRFRNARRAGPVTELILHETVTSSAKATVDVLQTRGLGVHFIVGPDGTIYQHGDLLDDELWHASQHNGPSVGIECVNPYYPKYIPGPASLWKTVIDAPWAHEGKYVVPTLEQSEAVCQLTAWLCSPDSGLSIPKLWVGMTDKKLAMGAVAAAKGLSPGIYAHHYFGHMDAAWLALYCWLRLEPGLGPQEAWDEAVRRTTGLHGPVDLADYFTGDAAV